MKRSEIKRKMPMRRAAVYRDVAKASAPLPKRMKYSRPKMTPIRKSAKDEDCTLRITGFCNYDPETTVWAHSNKIEDGKGMGIKARDEEGCYACSACHAWLDSGWVRDKGMTAELLYEFFDAARKKSQAILRQKGLL
mgnify:CR=1 FL=1